MNSSIPELPSPSELAQRVQSGRVNLFSLNSMKKTSGIYKITSPSARVYIGQSINIESRIKSYKKLHDCKKQPRLYNSLKIYGANAHIFEVIEACPVEQLNERERHWQDVFCATGDAGMNCRLTTTTDRSGCHSKASKMLMSKRQAGSNNPNFGKRGRQTATFGRKRTNSEREAIRAFQSTRGRIVQQFNLFGVLVKEARIRDFAAQGHSQGNISSCCNGRLKPITDMFLSTRKPYAIH
tara:strand:+ start:466 stop:1182 length:717 start_codon:yes stop_codon:yes gene_type:complete